MNPTTIAAELGRTVWAIDRTSLRALLAGALAGVVAPERPELAATFLDAEGQPMALTRPGPKAGVLAMVPVIGTLTKRDSFWAALFGMTSSDRLAALVRQLGADESVSTIVLDIQSPGGEAAGAPELAAAVRTARQTTTVVAVCNALAASGAYWLASQCDEIVATPEAIVGSVGVFIEHDDITGMLEQAGIKITYIASAAGKVDGNAGLALSDDGVAEYQAIVDQVFTLFVNDVADGRSMTPAQVRSGFGNGRVYNAKDAKALGMVDRIETMDQTIRRLSGGRSGGTKAEGAAEPMAAVASPEAEAAYLEQVAADAVENRRLLAARLELDQDHWLFGR